MHDCSLIYQRRFYRNFVMTTTQPTQTYTVQGMDCAGCAREVETGVSSLPGVKTAQVDFVTNTLRLTGDVTFDVLQERVQALGKSLVPPDAPPVAVDAAKRGGVIGFWDYLVDRP